jgi:hypothetical protein
MTSALCKPLRFAMVLVLTSMFIAPGRVFSVRGMTWEPTSTPEADLTRMRDEHGVNMINVYDAARVDPLLGTASRLGLRLIVRLEAYDPETFAFTADDARRVVEHHRDIIDKTRGDDRVAYLAVNMPIDDPRVQSRLGGVNSATSRQRQTGYARDVFRLLRAHTDRRIFLGLFYGWDGSYEIPRYDADGFVLTSYSYPRHGIADARSNTADLIDEPRLRTAADRATKDHPDRPIVVEYGFQTMTGHPTPPHQTAGLVRDDEAKRRALKATDRFYRTNYPQVIGTVYFGWNIRKPEGSPPRLLDFALIP